MVDPVNALLQSSLPVPLSLPGRRVGDDDELSTRSVGRVAHASDMPAVRAITREAARNDYRFSSLVLAIVKSDPFQMRTKATTGE